MITALLLAVAVLAILSQSMVSGQYITTTATSLVYNQTIDMPGTYVSGNTRMCSLQYFPSGGVSLSAGNEISGTLIASAPLYLAIVTTGYATAQGRGCINLLGSPLYDVSGASIQFEWTATRSCQCYVAVLNAGPNDIQGVLSINQVTSAVVYSPVYTPPLSETPYTTSYTPFYTYSSTPSSVSTSATGSSSPYFTAIEIGIIALIIAGAALAFIYGGKKRSQNETAERPSERPTSKIMDTEERKQSITEPTKGQTKATLGKQFCLECGNELPLGSKFCNKCGSKQA